MAWKQLIDPDWRKPYVGGWCEGYVEGCVGQATLPTASNQSTSGVYLSAIAAWNAESNKHYDLPPVGKTVPVYFSLGSTSNGHVALSLDDGCVASSTQAGFHTQGYIHPNLNNLISVYGQYNNGCTYLGWGEYIGRVRVIAPDVVMATIDQIKALFLEILERPADDDAINHYQSYTYDFVRADLFASQERKYLETAKANAALKEQQDAEAAAKAKAEEMEHILTPSIEKELLLLLGNPSHDPHQQPIPLS